MGLSCFANELSTFLQEQDCCEAKGHSYILGHGKKSSPLPAAARTGTPSPAASRSRITVAVHHVRSRSRHAVRCHPLPPATAGQSHVLPGAAMSRILPSQSRRRPA
nr:hypothetical protein Itr_chr13CG14930 [Ipomoea trifida]